MKAINDFLARIGRSSATLDKLLILKLNPKTGKAYWRTLSLIGKTLYLGYFAFALPLIGAILGIDVIGRFTEIMEEPPGIIGYAGIISFRGDWYFLACILGIAIAMIGLLISETASNYHKGMLYEGNGYWARPDGRRHKKGLFRGFGLS